MQKSKRPLRIAGVMFDPVETTSTDREIFWVELIERADLGGLLPMPGDGTDRYVARVLEQLKQRGVYWEFLATQIRRPGHPWMLCHVKGVAIFLRAVHEPLDLVKLEVLAMRAFNELVDCGAVPPPRARRAQP